MATQWNWAFLAPHIKCLSLVLTTACISLYGQDKGIVTHQRICVTPSYFRFLPPQVLILHSYLLHAPVVCRSAGRGEKKKKTLVHSHAVHILGFIDFL